MVRAVGVARICAVALVSLMLSVCASQPATVAGAPGAESGAQPAASSDSETAQRLLDDMQSTYQNARELTLQADEALFLPGNRIGDTATARKLYDGSDQLLVDFFDRWESAYNEDPGLFAALDILYVENTRGYAYIELAEGDTEESVGYRNDTVEWVATIMDAMDNTTWDNPDFPAFRRTLTKWLSEAHLFLYLDDSSKGDTAGANEHLKLARDNAQDPESKALIGRLLGQ